ncbi:UNVERIFIED_CONTAM: hypothetical protein GTU68_005053 [Idotea baltica]|nr:hypothetical protein [Idotea baltica]
MRKIDDIVSSSEKEIKETNSIKLGERAPNFELPDLQNKQISLKSLLHTGPLVVTFYRGSWCPYCNLALRALQASLKDIRALGADLIAISPEKPDNSLTNDEKEALDFTVLSDQNSAVATKYGIAWTVPDFIVEHMRNDRNLNLEFINNSSANVLPIPATFVLNTKGVVVWRYIDIDYRTRAEPSDILNALENLKGN